MYIEDKSLWFVFFFKLVTLPCSTPTASKFSRFADPFTEFNSKLQNWVAWKFCLDLGNFRDYPTRFREKFKKMNSPRSWKLSSAKVSSWPSYFNHTPQRHVDIFKIIGESPYSYLESGKTTVDSAFHLESRNTMGESPFYLELRNSSTEYFPVFKVPIENSR